MDDILLYDSEEIIPDETVFDETVFDEIVINGSSFKITINSADGGEIDFGELGQSFETLEHLRDDIAEFKIAVHNDFMFIGQLLIMILLFLIGKSIYGFLCGL